ncbi:hypothetical protein Closa_0761 [[Clostridium] saccharolyticum WM1]|uniref:Uncharacterized protein n=1 Tax=Lacrimispora saccharolytica (strain ATCC 35040 / DSM 2544 / NRCC 2533 / WM1) TaxID=610130 RepID=D9R5I0_LACSW|nr:hypothetical protein Closa_0761 [[Clostridium] saccharolyticum WM1]
MGEFYGKRIRISIITIDQVPAYWLAKTQKWLEEN